jgi:hypothetical protein
MSTTIDGSNSVTINSGAILGITSSTAVASTSGTSIDFTSIPSWVKRITVMFSGVSTSGTSAIQIQTGAGSITATGYNSIGGFYTNANQTAVSTATTGFVEAVSGAITAAATRTGAIVIQNLTSNTWIASGVYGNAGNTVMTSFTGSIALSGTLDRVRITTVNGTDTFDAGSINILYE